jgi:phosphoribosylformylglycinamidine (FGAM) synthase-like amidotransferase family enzyme
MEAYANFMGIAGARVVPFIVNDDQTITDDKLTKVNAVLFPGGGGDYLDIGNYIY